MDEHDPGFDPEMYPAPQESWWDFFMALGRLTVLAAAVGMVIAALPGCDGEYERQLRIQEWRDKFVNACLPRKGDQVIASWVKGDLVCKRVTPSGRYGRTFPHAEVKVATIDEVEL